VDVLHIDLDLDLAHLAAMVTVMALTHIVMSVAKDLVQEAVNTDVVALGRHLVPPVVFSRLNEDSNASDHLQAVAEMTKTPK
jgi:hypothetical protein